MTIEPWLVSQVWLDARRVAVGTKCNKLLIVDTRYMNITEARLPPPPPRPPTTTPRRTAEHGSCGIHCLALSPGGELLATGGTEAADCVILRTDDMQPVLTLVVNSSSTHTAPKYNCVVSSGVKASLPLCPCSDQSVRGAL